MDERPQHDSTTHGARERQPWAWNVLRSSDVSNRTGVIKSESLDERRQHDSTAHGARERQPWAWNVSRSSDVSNRTAITKTDPANGRGEHDSSTAGDIPNWQIKPSARNPPSSSDPSYRRGIIKSETIDDSYEQNSSGYGGSSASPQAEPLNRNHPNSSAECFRRVITKTDPANSRGEHDSSTADDIPNWQKKPSESSSDPSYRRGIIKTETIDDSYQQNSSGCGGSSVSPQAEPLSRSHPSSSDDSFREAVIKSEPSDDGYQQHSSAHGGHPAPSQKALKRKAPPSSDECYRKRSEGLLQCMVGPQRTKLVDSEKNPALSSKADAPVEAAAPKEVAKLEELPRREVQQLTPEVVARVRKPRRRGTILLEELPPADVLFLEQPTPKKAAVFRKLLSENAASLAEPFAVSHQRTVEATPRKAAVFGRMVSRRAATSGNPTPGSHVVLEKPPARKTIAFGRPPRKPLDPLKRLTSKMAAAIVADSTQSSKKNENGDTEMADAVCMEPAISEEKMSAICVEAKVTVKENEMEATNRNTGGVQSGSVAGRELRALGEIWRGGGTLDSRGIADDPDMLVGNAGNAEVAGGDLHHRLCTSDRREEEKDEEKEDDDELEGEVRDNSSTEASSQGATDDMQFTSSSTRITYNTGSSSSSSGTSSGISSRAFCSSGSEGLGLSSRPFYAELVDRLKNLQSFNSARPDLHRLSSPSTENSYPNNSRRYENTIWAERAVAKRKWSGPSDVDSRRAPLIDYSDLFD
ncbi:unnamed protein product [Heligmosomoides polygyrus]|uniref:Uncharacterized protein n=1 Tax=Heligmosomoides polygyrus TaxID=6339 RepID=A0A3P7YSU8_HELPZ|nr:unnamed protein product [Heligmosomoides polygyrus]